MDAELDVNDLITPPPRNMWDAVEEDEIYYQFEEEYLN